MRAHHHSPILRRTDQMIHQHRYIGTLVDVATFHPKLSPLTKPKQELARQLWIASGTAFDLNRIGVEMPEQMSALFVMDGEEIAEITRDVAPLTDFYPKRLNEVHPDLDAAYRFAYGYMESSAALS